MRTEGPFPLPCTQSTAPNASSPIPIRDYLYKTVEVSGLTSGTLKIQVRADQAFNTVTSVTVDGLYLIDHQGFEMRVDATIAVGASLKASLTAVNARAD